MAITKGDKYGKPLYKNLEDCFGEDKVARFADKSVGLSDS